MLSRIKKWLGLTPEPVSGPEAPYKLETPPAPPVEEPVPVTVEKKPAAKKTASSAARKPAAKRTKKPATE
jgi:hypothetical protein